MSKCSLWSSVGVRKSKWGTYMDYKGDSGCSCRGDYFLAFDDGFFFAIVHTVGVFVGVRGYKPSRCGCS